MPSASPVSASRRPAILFRLSGKPVRAARLQLWLASTLLAHLFIANLPAAGAVSAYDMDTAAQRLFRQTWQRQDGPVAAQLADRSWLWGPGPFEAWREDYLEAPGGVRPVMYFDKARMELTRAAEPEVSFGLLVAEMISGRLQMGDNLYTAAPAGPAEINVAGDPGNWLTYARLAPYASLNLDRRAENLTGRTADLQLTENDGLQPAGLRAGQQILAYYEPVLGHNIPLVFWDFLKRRGPIYYPGITNFGPGQPVEWLREVGYPLTEAYWARQKVGGQYRDVLVQAFQRRTLTFTPDNPPAYQVEMGNAGRHYAQWRYGRDFGPNLVWPVPPVSQDGYQEVFRGPAGFRRVAITLDAGSTAVAYPAQIAALQKYRARATFFLTGDWAARYPHFARQIAEAGMEIANHTYNHPEMTALSDRQARDEINRAAEVIEQVTGRSPRPFFRFPYGSRNGRLLQLVRELGYRSIYWSYDSQDSVGLPKSALYLYSRITGLSDRELDGGIILMHIGNASSGEALGPILENLQSRGFQAVTVSELLTAGT